MTKKYSLKIEDNKKRGYSDIYYWLWAFETEKKIKYGFSKDLTSI